VHSLLFITLSEIHPANGKTLLELDIISSMAETDPSNHSLLSKTRFLLDHYDLKAKKGLGQHFLINSGVLKNIMRAADLSSEDLVLEIGPGIGVLTHELVQQAGWVIAIEVDKKLAEALRETLVPHQNFSIVNQDVLEIEPRTLIKKEMSSLPASIQDCQKYKVVANLPYYITQPIIRHFCEAELKPQTMTIMVQKEVAKNIVAGPGELSILAISVQFYGKPQIMGYVAAANFYPVPKVDSAILKIALYPELPWQVDSSNNFFKIVRAGFCAARKQILNSLSQGLAISRSDVLNWLERAGVDPQKRAETLSLEEWASLERSWNEAAKT
jgi:16S rRNA (adenine1518-N6/adenine1519-N6)-dimethyltransferase